MHVNSLCACSHSEAMKGSSSLRLLILSRFLASPVWAQLTLTDPTWGARSLYLQNGDPFHRVRAHHLTGVQNRDFIVCDSDSDLGCILFTYLDPNCRLQTVTGNKVLLGLERVSRARCSLASNLKAETSCQ
jgi:hypothetical protein